MSDISSALESLSLRSQTCLQRLIAHRASPRASPYPPSVKQAAVLVALFERPDRSDGLRVLLTTRARHLRSHPGQTALPGGKIDAEDAGPIEAARREAWEEVGLPVDPSHPDVRYVCTLDPFLSKYKLVVHPIVYLLSSSAVVDALQPSPDEVAGIFEHPLEALLDGKWEGDNVAKPSERGGADWPYEDEYYVSALLQLQMRASDTPRLRTTRTCPGSRTRTTACIASVPVRHPSRASQPTYFSPWRR